MNQSINHELFLIRALIVQQAEGLFGMRVAEMSQRYVEELTYSDTIKVHSQSILNLLSEQRVYHNSFHKEFEKILDEIAETYELTFGEKIKILSSRLSADARYIIQLERHNDVVEEGELK